MLMETNEEARVEDCISLQKVADSAVYQLARDNGNGILVPATDDEVMAVEDLLEDCKSQVRTPETTHTLETSADYGCGSCDSSKILLKGHQQPLEVIQGLTVKSNMLSEPATDQDEKRVSLLVPKTNDESVNQFGSPEECSEHLSGFDDVKSSDPVVGLGPGLKPDFSLLNGEIHLDSLSVRDLQETFRATFGRETSVKDKQWLKRRIIMGLTNSCDFSTTNFTIIDNKVVKNGKEETCKSVVDSVRVHCADSSAVGTHQNPATGDDKPVEIHSIASPINLQSSNPQDISGNLDVCTEERPAKRVRKPTKRYIELWEEESRDSSSKLICSVKKPVNSQSSAKSCSRPVLNFGLDGRCFSRKDSLGGSGVEIPYVSRIRRGRPRENFMTLMKLHPSGIGISTRLEKNDVACGELSVIENVNKVEDSLSPRWNREPPPAAASSETNNPDMGSKTIQLEQEVQITNEESLMNAADGEVFTVPTASGGMRRKHHRPWTLTEVVKLVEGVAKYGAGRWSEIKRLAFSSYSYRTSVDLKDKWRNLLRASLAELPTNGVHVSRKPASAPIPGSILLRVRELADVQAQLLPSKLSGHGDGDSTGIVH